MYPESTHRWGELQRDSFFEMVQAGKESYYIVSQFDLFEYAQEAPFFARLSGSFEACIYGLNMVRGYSTGSRRFLRHDFLLLGPDDANHVAFAAC